MDSKNIQFYFFSGLLGLVFIVNILLFFPFLKFLAVIVILAVVFYPLYLKLKLWLKRQGVSAFMTILLVGVIVMIPLVFFFVNIFNEAKDLYTILSGGGYLNNTAFIVLEEKVKLFAPDFNLATYLETALEGVLGSISTIFSSVLHVLFLVFLGIVALFFFLRDGKKLIGTMMSASPLATVYDEAILDKLRHAINSIVRGTLVVALVQGILAGAGFLIFGVPSPAVWGGVTVFASLIPGVGTAIVMGPAIIYLFAAGNLLSAVGLLIWGVVIVGLVDNVLRPFLVGRDVNIHPFLVLLSVFGGLALYGPIGFLLGPLTLSCLYVLLEIYPMITEAKKNI